MSGSDSDEDQLVNNLQKVVVTHLKKRGTREDVWNGFAMATSGELTRDDLMMSNGKLVSKKASEKSKQLMLCRHAAKKEVEKPKASKKSLSRFEDGI